MDLPEEIMEEILLRVGAKALLKFRCVSKSWHHVIDSQRFRKAQLENSRTSTRCQRREVILNTSRSLVHSLRVQSLLNGSCLDRNKLWWSHADMVGCFNGLVCLVLRDRAFIMWNPSTKKFKRLPALEGFLLPRVVRFGMGWFESSGEYKIFAAVEPLYPNPARPEFENYKIYSSNTNSWKTVRPHGSKFTCSEKKGLFLRGKLHWVLRDCVSCDEDEVVVVSFDFEREVYGFIELPFKRARHESFLLLGELGGCLCAILDRRYESFEYVSRSADVWVMEEYGVKESWKKLEPPFPASSLFAERENGEIVVFFGSAILVYHPKENMFYHLHIDKSPYPLRMLLCMETLASSNIASSSV